MKHCTLLRIKVGKSKKEKIVSPNCVPLLKSYRVEVNKLIILSENKAESQAGCGNMHIY